MRAEQVATRMLSSTHWCRQHAPAVAGAPSAGDWHSTSCRFETLCFDPREVNTSSRGFHYLLADAASLSAAANELKMSLKPLGRPGTTPWTPRLVLPSEQRARANDYATAYRFHGPAVLLAEYNAENPGHFLMDTLLPIYAMLELFDAAAVSSISEVQPLRIDSSDTPWNCDWHATTNNSNVRKRYPFFRSQRFREAVWTAYRRTKLANCDRIYSTFASLLTRRPFLRPSAAAAPSGLTCFDEAYAGAGMLSDHCQDEYQHGRKDLSSAGACNAGKGPLLLRFRAHVMRMAGVAEGASCSLRPRLIAVSESNKRGIANLREVVGALCPWAVSSAGYSGGCSLERPSTMSLKVQLELFSQTTLYLGVCGGAAIFTLFMPRGATAILYCPEADNRLDWGVMEHSHVRAVYRCGQAVPPPSGQHGGQWMRAPVPKLKSMLSRALAFYRTNGACGASASDPPWQRTTGLERSYGCGKAAKRRARTSRVEEL